MKKQISMADLSRGHINLFRGDTRGLFFVVIQEVSARSVRKELINHNLHLFARPLRVDCGWPFVNDAKFKK